MTTLHLVRHGETEWNRARRYQGQTDVPLSEVGREQARKLQPCLDLTAYDALYVSDLKRAAETADILLDGASLQRYNDERLREIRLGVFEGLTHEEITAQYPNTSRSWYGDPNNVPEGAESLDVFAERLRGFMTFIREEYPQGTLLIVAHGGSISMLTALALGVEPTKRWQFRLANTGLSHLTLYDDGAYLERWNDVSHLTM
jgi:alpha-ribazole phosphatase